MCTHEHAPGPTIPHHAQPGSTMPNHAQTDILGRGQIGTQWLKADPGVVNLRARRVCETPKKCTMKPAPIIYGE